MATYNRPQYTEADNVIFVGDSWGYDDAAPASHWRCAYCGQRNNAEREECRSCRAPLLEVA